MNILQQMLGSKKWTSIIVLVLGIVLNDKLNLGISNTDLTIIAGAVVTVVLAQGAKDTATAATRTRQTLPTQKNDEQLSPSRRVSNQERD